MAYTRTTADEYRLHVDYGEGWEEVHAESTRAAIREQVTAYRANCKYPVKWSGPHRVPIN